jgi:hypothetical protein
MQKIYRDGVFRQIGITPCEGYVLRDNFLDNYMEYDEEGNGIGEPIIGFYSGTTTVRYDYDFVANPREFYAVLIEDVPEGAEIFNVPSSDHEVM